MKLEDYPATDVSKALKLVRDQLRIAALTEVASFVDGPEEDPYAVYVAKDAGLFVLMVAEVGDLTRWRDVSAFRLGVVGRAVDALLRLARRGGLLEAEAARLHDLGRIVVAPLQVPPARAQRADGSKPP